MVTGAWKQGSSSSTCAGRKVRKLDQRGAGPELGEPSQKAWQLAGPLHDGNRRETEGGHIHISPDGHKISIRNPPAIVLTLKMRKHTEKWKDTATVINNVVL